MLTHSLYDNADNSSGSTFRYTKYFPATCIQAVKYNDISTLIQLYDTEYQVKKSEMKEKEWSIVLCRQAALRGYLDCLQYLYGKGCMWDETTCDGASLSCLQFAHENGCPWNHRTTYSAAAGGHLDCLQYAIEHGCPVDVYAYNIAVRHEHTEVAEYLANHLSQHKVRTPEQMER